MPLCVDFGHRGATGDEVRTMWRPDYHSTVSFDRDTADGYWGGNGGPLEPNRAAQAVLSLPRMLDYATGLTVGSGNQRNNRHLLLVKSDDQMGATYLVMRDITSDGQPNQRFTWNLWVMAKEPEIAGNVAHFPGLFGVDLDAHVLTPANPAFTKNAYKYRQWVNPWGFFEEEQTGVHTKKSGSKEDFFSVLYPRAQGQGPAEVTRVGEKAVLVKHMEGVDLVLLSPGKAATAEAEGVALTGEIAFARRYTNRTLRLVVLKGAGEAHMNGWKLSANGPTAVEVKNGTLTGESSGDAHEAVITLPAGAEYGQLKATLDDKPFPTQVNGLAVTLRLPAGSHTFSLSSQ
ncbi:MAG: hypothetical protein BWY76_01858 [bacterium ADurb.Bin429]|nr:MAG: hypothetical protein BWY76_01858 [bacterium ADurb.Bin429]